MKALALTSFWPPPLSQSACNPSSSQNLPACQTSCHGRRGLLLIQAEGRRVSRIPVQLACWAPQAACRPEAMADAIPLCFLSYLPLPLPQEKERNAKRKKKKGTAAQNEEAAFPPVAEDEEMEVSGTSGNEEEMAEEAEGEVPGDCSGGHSVSTPKAFGISGLRDFRLHWAIALLPRLSGGWLFWGGHAKEELPTWPSPSLWVGELWELLQLWSSEAEGLSQSFPPCSLYKGAFSSLSCTKERKQLESDNFQLFIA